MNRMNKQLQTKTVVQSASFQRELCVQSELTPKDHLTVGAGTIIIFISGDFKTLINLENPWYEISESDTVLNFILIVLFLQIFSWRGGM